MKIYKVAGSLLFLIGLIALWQLLYVAATDWLAWVKPYAVPYPAGVAKSAKTLLISGTLFAAVGKSMLRVFAGFLISIVVGVLFGILIIRSEYFARNLKPLLLGIQTLPSICWVPFAILWFGLTESAIIFVVVMGSVFSVSLAVESGIREVPPIYIKAAKTMGVSSHKMYTKVIFPAALPSFVAGLKQAWSFAWRALMSGEVMSASLGLGYTLMMGRDLADINQVMTVMLVIIMIGIVIDKGIFSNVENYLLKKRGLK
ncbi:MAG: ABC transporter permease [Muribaculaceae bacterium]|nr:ABC transporter permease [Roseburia sp.]MCM1429860.1 ABC transporter permease [Muribaculaceae bacterium]MCM1492911.1 ABC transporter permease [Muribaculaceae bacterium]